LALIDTGASHTCADYDILKLLGVEQSGEKDVLTPAGLSKQSTFLAKLEFPSLTLEVPLAQLIGTYLSAQNIVILLGRDLLYYFVFTYDGPGKKLTLSFPDPPQANP